MAKPIFIVFLPQGVLRSQFESFEKEIKNQLTDYHCLFVISNKDDIEFQCLNYTNKDDPEFKKIIDTTIQNKDDVKRPTPIGMTWPVL